MWLYPNPKQFEALENTVKTMRDFSINNGHAKKGFTLAEMMITLSLVGVMAVMLMQLVFSATANSNGLVRVKEIAQQIQNAASTLQTSNPGLVNPSGAQIAALMNFTSTTTTTTLFTGLTDASPVNCTQAATISCYRFSNESVLMTDNNPLAQIGGVNYTRFLVDPDGARPNPPVALIYRYDTGRLTTESANRADTGQQVSGFTDPDYVRDWTKL